MLFMMSAMCHVAYFETMDNNDIGQISIVAPAWLILARILQVSCKAFLVVPARLDEACIKNVKFGFASI